MNVVDRAGAQVVPTGPDGLGLVTTLAAETIAGTAAAAVTVGDLSGRKLTRGETDPVAERANRAQYEIGQGPALDCWSRRTVVRVDDLVATGRWPAWRAAAVELGLRSVLAAPLVAGDECLGAITLYSRRTRAYGARAEHLLTMFAAHCSTLLATAGS